jgi:hypothetical protein
MMDKGFLFETVRILVPVPYIKWEVNKIWVPLPVSRNFAIASSADSSDGFKGR